MWARLSSLLAFAVITVVSPVLACVDDGIDASYGGVYRPFPLSIDGIPSGVTLGPLSGGLPIHTPGFIRLGLLRIGDHWDIPDSGATDLVSWGVQVRGDGDSGSEAIRVALWGKAEGTAKISVRYVPATGAPAAGAIILHIGPPLPPPPPPTLIVEADRGTRFFDKNRPLLIRVTAPLAADHRWEVKEALYSDRSSGDEEPWKQLAITPSATEAGLFETAPPGERVRIVFVQRRDGWQLFPETVTLLLIAKPIPKC